MFVCIVCFLFGWFGWFDCLFGWLVFIWLVWLFCLFVCFYRIVQEDRSNLMQSDPSVLKVLTRYHTIQSGMTGSSKGTLTYSVLLLHSYYHFRPLTFPSLQSKRLAVIGWRMQVMRLECSRCAEPFQLYGYADTPSL